MGRIQDVRVPDIGDFDEVEIVEVLVASGDTVEAEQGLVMLESDKASMEVPSPSAGTVLELKVAEGSKVGQDALILTLEIADQPGEANKDTDLADGAKAEAAAPEVAAPKPAAPETSAPSPASSSPAAATGAAPTQLPDADVQADLLVLGSGPGGYSAAFRAADLGLNVVLVERFPILGGVCLNVGCIPSKALLHAAKVIDEARAFADHGIQFGQPQIDLDRLRQWKDDVVQRLTGGLGTMAKQRKVTVVQGTGRFAGPHLLEVDGEDGASTVAFHQAILAVGSQPVKLPGLPWEDPRLMDSTDALELQEVPERLLVVGGGIIGLEMATVYHALGSRITVVELLDSLMPGTDKDLVRRYQRWIKPRYEAVHLGVRVDGIEATEEGLEVRFASGKEGVQAPEPATFDRVLVAVGRRANGDRIAAEKAGVEVDERGLIRVDRQLRTNVPHIFAIGDLVGQPMLAHKAIHEGKVAAEVAAGEDSAFDARHIPAVAYTDPEVAWVGLTEIEAKAQGIAYETGTFPWAASGRSLSLGRDEGATKLLFDPQSGRLLGAGIVGPAAGDLIAEATLALEMGCDAADLGLTIHPHPTLSETVAMSAEAFEGTLTDLYLPKRKRRGHG